MAKILFNSILSTPNAKFMTIDLKDFYLGMPMTCYEYLHVLVTMLSLQIIKLYNLTPLIHKGFIYAEIC